MENYKKLLLDMFKHSSSRSGIEAACDLADLFRSISTIVGSGKYHHFIVERTFEREVRKALSRAEAKGLSPNADTKKLILHFICRVPQIMTKALSTRSAGVGFVRDGMVDAFSHTWPDIEKAFCTLTRRPTQFEWDSLIDNFDNLVDEQFEDGIVSEDAWYSIGYRLDVNDKGEGEELNTQAESYQRCKCLSNDNQKGRRKATEVNRLEKERQVDRERILHQNRQCEKNLDAENKLIRFKRVEIMAQMRADLSNPESDDHQPDENALRSCVDEVLVEYKDATGRFKPEFYDEECDDMMYSNLTTEDLKAFIIVRKYQQYPSSGRHGLSNRSKPQLVTMAMELSKQRKQMGMVVTPVAQAAGT